VRVLLFGSQGMLGHDLLAEAPAGVELVSPTLDEVDITDPVALGRAVDAARPDWVLNAAAYTLVDEAESATAVAHAVNATAVGIMAAACARRRCRLAHFSTDYVFSGLSRRPYREEDPTAPINAYGASKLAGEQAILASGATALILRTQWLFGEHGRCFPRTMWQRAQARQPTRVVDDQWGRPTSTVDLAGATWSLILREASGIFHVANSGLATWYDVAHRVFEAAERGTLLARCTAVEHPTPARRPAYSVLDTSRVEPVLGGALPAWTDALDRFLARLLRTVPS
jgi:dTDP-4-dehydrorhamnose reductase